MIKLPLIVIVDELTLRISFYTYKNKPERFNKKIIKILNKVVIVLSVWQ